MRAFLDAARGEHAVTARNGTYSDRFGAFGGRYVPETLIPALDELDGGVRRRDARSGVPAAARRRCCANYVGRPSPLSDAPRLSARVGAPVWLKREDLNHTGAHKINNTLGQALLARRMGKRRIIAETGAGQHGVATATVCARFGLECVVYMGEEDMRRQALNVFRMRLIGAKVVPVTSGHADAEGRDQRGDSRLGRRTCDDSYYIIGSVVGPGPYPRMVRDFQSVIGREARAQMLERAGALPRTVVACVGGGSNAIGIFHAFVDDRGGRAGRRRGGGRGARHGRARGVALAGTPGRAARRAELPAAGRRTDRCTRRTRSPRGSTIPASVPSTRTCKDTGRAHVRRRHRRRGARRLPTAGAPRGHHPGARDRARGRLDRRERRALDERRAGAALRERPRRQGRGAGRAIAYLDSVMAACR